MADESVAALLTGICDPCAEDRHDRCTAEQLGDGCLCQCTGVTTCPTCHQPVVLWADPSEPGLSSGDCCTWSWVDYWEGTFRLDLREGATDAEV